MTKTNSSRHTKADIALCFGERTGYDVDPKDIRIKGNWLFHRAEWLDDEVDCYWAADARYDSGVLCMEAWDGVKIEDSPFIPKNDERVAKSLKELDEDYKQHLFEQTPEGQLATKQDEAEGDLVWNAIEKDPLFKKEVKLLHQKLQDKLDEEYGENKKIQWGVSTDDLREANLITQELEDEIQKAKDKVEKDFDWSPYE
tara:strand:+ start:1025 stop:1621 length:597 start_codon:yes stop_codon:yes gene_type:complete